MASNITQSRPAGQAILRKLTQPLYDTNILENAAATANVQFFRLPVGAPMPVTAVAKTEADTNLNQAGQLGTPQMFDLEGFNVEYSIVDYTDVADNAADLILLYQQSVFTFFFGQNRPWLELPLSQIPTGCYLTGNYQDGDVTANTEAMWVHEGLARVSEVYNFTVGKQAIRVHPAEAFNAEITWPNGAVTWNAARSRIRCYMIGSLYTAL